MNLSCWRLQSCSAKAAASASCGGVAGRGPAPLGITMIIGRPGEAEKVLKPFGGCSTRYNPAELGRAKVFISLYAEIERGFARYHDQFKAEGEPPRRGRRLTCSIPCQRPIRLSAG